MKVVTSFEEVNNVLFKREEFISNKEYENTKKLLNDSHTEIANDLDEISDNSIKPYNLKKELHPFIPLVVSEMLRVVLDKNESTKHRIRCMQLILDRYDGKPTEHVEIRTSVDIEKMGARDIFNNIISMRDSMPTTSRGRAVLVAAQKEAEAMI